MAEPGNKTSLVTTPPPSANVPAKIETPALPTLENLTMQVKTFDAGGNATVYSFQMPAEADFNQWAIATQVGMLKSGPWSKLAIQDIFWGLAYAKKIGADVMQGDLFPTGEGRWGTSNKFKIKQAFKTGKIKSYKTEIKPGKMLDTPLPKCKVKTDLECTATIYVKDMDEPITKSSTLSRWHNDRNPNWNDRPEHMLELNTLAHACEYVSMLAGEGGMTEDDEAPPAPSTPTPGGQFDPGKSSIGPSLVESLKEDVIKERTGGAGPTTLEAQLIESVEDVNRKKATATDK